MGEFNICRVTIMWPIHTQQVVEMITIEQQQFFFQICQVKILKKRRGFYLTQETCWLLVAICYLTNIINRKWQHRIKTKFVYKNLIRNETIKTKLRCIIQWFQRTNCWPRVPPRVSSYAQHRYEKCMYRFDDVPVVVSFLNALYYREALSIWNHLLSSFFQDIVFHSFSLVFFSHDYLEKVKISNPKKGVKQRFKGRRHDWILIFVYYLYYIILVRNYIILWLIGQIKAKIQRKEEASSVTSE